MQGLVGLGLVLLPLASFLAALLLIGSQGPAGRDKAVSSWRRAFLLAAIAWSAAGTIILELLSLFEGITPLKLAIAWSTILVGLLVALDRRSHLLSMRPSIPKLSSVGGPGDKLVTSGIAVCVCLLFAIAVVAPPNTVDSLLYHMTRAANWAQNASLRHYAANYGHQLIMPIWAESQILQLRILWGGDRLSNLVQWFSMVGSLIGVSEIARLFRAPRTGQLLAAAFAVSVPMGILQATSTQNDYVVTFWLVCLGYLVVSDRLGERSRGDLLFLGLALGLSLLTKATAYLYALPFVAWYLVFVSRRDGFAFAVKASLIIASLAVVLNLGYWGRNYATYDGPLGPSDFVSDFVRLGPGPDLSESDHPLRRMTQDWPANLLSRVSTTLARNIMTPSFGLSAWLFARIPSLPLGLPAEFESEMLASIWNHEDTAGNPLHLAFVPLTVSVLGLGVALGRRRLSPGVGQYMVCAVGGLLLLALVLENGPSLFGLRFQLPFFVMWSPIVGSSLSRILGRKAARLIAGGFLLTSVPWLLFNNTRPAIGRQPYVTRTQSIFVAPQAEIMFAMAPHLREPYTEATDRIRATGCTKIALRIDSSDPGYLFWWLLSAPESGYRIESIATYDVLARYLVPYFVPCAVICTTCSEASQFPGLSQEFSSDAVRLYLPVDTPPSGNSKGVCRQTKWDIRSDWLRHTSRH